MPQVSYEIYTPREGKKFRLLGRPFFLPPGIGE